MELEFKMNLDGRWEEVLGSVLLRELQTLLFSKYVTWSLIKHQSKQYEPNWDRFT